MESVSPSELKAFFAYVVEVLERVGIPYMVVGGFAAVMHGEPRLTIDIDIIQPSTGAKVDVVPLPRDIFTRLAFQRRRPLVYDNQHSVAYFITPEDIVLAKLMAYRATGSEKHLRDVRGVLVIQWGQLDLDAIRRGANGAGVLDQFEQLLELVRKEVE